MIAAGLLAQEEPTTELTEMLYSSSDRKPSSNADVVFVSSIPDIPLATETNITLNEKVQLSKATESHVTSNPLSVTV